MFKKLVVMLSILPGMAVQAGTSTTTVNISGTVINASCDVDLESENQRVEMGDISPAEFPTQGATSSAQKFAVQLRVCSASEVMTSFSGSAQDPADNSLLALSGDSPATGLAIQVLDDSGEAMDISRTHVTTLSGSNPRLNYQLRYKSTADVVTTGDASGTLFMTFSYP